MPLEIASDDVQLNVKKPQQQTQPVQASEAKDVDLAQYASTELGSSVQQNPQPKQVNQVKTGSVLRLEGQIQAMEKQLVGKKDQEFKLNLRKSLLNEEIGEVSYYTELGNFYEQKMNNTKNKYDKLAAEVSMLSSRKQAEGAAKALAGAARGRTARAATADRAEIKTAYDVARNDFDRRSREGGFTAADQLEAKNLLANRYEAHLEGQRDDETLTFSQRNAASDNIIRLHDEMDNQNAKSIYGGLNHQNYYADDYRAEMDVNGKITYGLNPSLPAEGYKAQTIDGTFVKAEGGVWKETTNRWKLDKDSNMYISKNVETGDIERLSPIEYSGKLDEINETMYVNIPNPKNPLYEANEFKIREDGQFENLETHELSDQPYLRNHLGNEDLLSPTAPNSSTPKPKNNDLGLPDFNQKKEEEQPQQQNAADLVSSAQSNVGGYNEWKSQFGNRV